MSLFQCRGPHIRQSVCLNSNQVCLQLSRVSEPVMICAACTLAHISLPQATCWVRQIAEYEINSAPTWCCLSYLSQLLIALPLSALPSATPPLVRLTHETSVILDYIQEKISGWVWEKIDNVCLSLGTKLHGQNQEMTHDTNQTGCKLLSPVICDPALKPLSSTSWHSCFSEECCAIARVLNSGFYIKTLCVNP